MSIHIELDGAYVQCASKLCKLPIHLPLVTVEEAKQLPYRMLLTLIEAIDPPAEVNADGTKLWRDSTGDTHRDYDLPAMIYPQGLLEWMQHGEYARGHDKPTSIESDGTLYWEEGDGDFHRDGGKPAIISPDGREEYWVHGRKSKKRL